jgi:GNAT superfamily N-acetyltransferase
LRARTNTPEADKSDFLNPTTNLAEVAFMVAPEWQGRGLGSALQRRLQEYASARGVRGFTAEIWRATRA